MPVNPSNYTPSVSPTAAGAHSSATYLIFGLVVWDREAVGTFHGLFVNGACVTKTTAAMIRHLLSLLTA